MGYFLEVASDYGCKVEGVDISEFAAKHCSDKLNINTHCGTLESAKFEKESFDIITADLKIKRQFHEKGVSLIPLSIYLKKSRSVHHAMWPWPRVPMM